MKGQKKHEVVRGKERKRKKNEICVTLFNLSKKDDHCKEKT